MGLVVTFEAPGVVGFADEAEAPLTEHEVRIRTIYSGISAGTELTAYRGSNPYLDKRWDDARRLFVADRAASLRYPIAGWGYEEVGRIEEVGSSVTSVLPGQVVWGTWGHRSSVVVAEAWTAARVLPTETDPIVGVFSQIGSIALNALLDANVHLGEVLAVFGQGVPGLLVTQLARLNGATVVGIDGIARRLELSRALGADRVVDHTEESPAEIVKAMTDGRGADVSIEISGSAGALHEAVRSTAYNSKVVTSGFFQGGASALLLGEEFHHNRIEIVCSQISGVSRSIDHRWNEARLQRTFMTLAAEGRIDVEPLISHVIPAREAADAFRLLDEHPEETVQVVLDFGDGWSR
jgi:2-desacetyl-2-hydroxyethyl bacteriochlorophyllide A dehydrogenase